MNNDLISREALKEEIDDYAEKRQDTLLWQSDIEEIIDNAPTVEARQQGAWKRYNGYYRTCSICGNTVGFDYPDKRLQSFNFCPNCGADMRGGAE